MRIGEIVLVFINGVILVQFLIRTALISQKSTQWLSGIGAVIAVFHLIVEGYRWQMVPLYFLIGALMLPMAGKNNNPKFYTHKIAAAGLAVLGIGIVLSVILPVPKLPQPSGPYDIGTVSYEWVDTSRKEIYGETPGEPRKIMVQIWYPAKETSSILRLPWLESTKIARAMASRDHLPAFLIKQVKLARTHTYADVDVKPNSTPYPVVVYIHGWSGFRNINQDQIEALASNGYIVISADHTYGALITLFPDGHVAYNDPQALNGDGSEKGKERASNLLVHVYADDVSFMLDQVTQLNENDPDGRFTGKLDLDAVGVYGHSTGGGAAVQACANDVRCKAVLGMDTWIEPVDDKVIQNGLTQPLMTLNSESFKSGPNRNRLQELYTTTPAPRYMIDIAGTKHYDFVMVPTFSPLASLLGFSGSLPAKEILSINETYLVAFFDRHLRNRDIPWLDQQPVGMEAVEYEYQRANIN